MENEQLDPTPVHNNDTLDTLLLIAFIFMILGTIGLAVFIIPLAWCIPMTITCYNNYKNHVKPSIALGVCSLIFVSLVAGILLLIAGAQED